MSHAVAVNTKSVQGRRTLHFTSLDEVAKLYEQELTLLACDAKITQFLGVLTSKRVRMRLRKH